MKWTLVKSIGPYSGGNIASNITLYSFTTTDILLIKPYSILKINFSGTMVLGNYNNNEVYAGIYFGPNATNICVMPRGKNVTKSFNQSLVLNKYRDTYGEDGDPTYIIGSYSLIFYDEHKTTSNTTTCYMSSFSNTAVTSYSNIYVKIYGII